jgi:hypothetical protein
MRLSIARRLSLAATALVAGYGAYVAVTWLRYGRVKQAPNEEADPLLDQFMPEYEVVERHSTFVRAPAEVTLAAACEMDFGDSRLAGMIFKGRELLLRAGPPEEVLPSGLLAKTKALGWGLLAEVPAREIVMGAVTQPWEANVVFRALPPDRFASFDDPAYVKIAWTLRADPVTASTSVFRTETRVLACGPLARTRFRKYWALLSPGIILIRRAMLGSLRRDAERESM